MGAHGAVGRHHVGGGGHAEFDAGHRDGQPRLGVDFMGLDDALLGHVAELGLGVGGFDLLAGV